MPARELIDAGELDRVAQDLRFCRDRPRLGNCDAYAEQRFNARHPTEDRRTWNSILGHARTSVSYGNGANRAGPDAVIRGDPGYTPADTQYAGGNRNPMRYRYGVAVNVTVAGGPNAGHTFPLSVYVNSREALTTSEIRDEAVAQAQRVVGGYLKDYEVRAGADTEITADTRINSVVRDRG